jgi:ketosteroid isomerase-like protein
MSTEEITDFLSRWTAAELARDTATLGAILADDFVGVGPLGFLLTKREWLGRHEDASAGALRYTSFELQDVSPRVYDGAAVVIARQVAEGTFGGNPLPTTMRASLILVGEGDARRLAGIHMSFVAGTPGAPPIPGRS